MNKEYKMSIAGNSYVGLDTAMLLAQHNQVVAVDIVAKKVALMNMVVRVAVFKKC